jgi:signal transduction histidine kinase
VEPSRPAGGGGRDPRFALRVDVGGSGILLEQVLQILREGITNVRRHADAESATMRVEDGGDGLTITIDDDGRGFRDARQRPWSIASRVRSLGGDLNVVRDARPGAHLEIVLPGG